MWEREISKSRSIWTQEDMDALKALVDTLAGESTESPKSSRLELVVNNGITSLD